MLVLDTQDAAQYDRVLVKLRCLPGLNPATWTSHVRHAGR